MKKTVEGETRTLEKEPFKDGKRHIERFEQRFERDAKKFEENPVAGRRGATASGGRGAGLARFAR